MKRYYIVYKLFLLALFITFQAGTSLFYHVHVYNGTLYFHSHPYHQVPAPSNSSPGHSHAGGEFAYFHHIQEQTFHDFICGVYVPHDPAGITVTFREPLQTRIIATSCNVNLQRGPPYLPIG